MTQERDKTVCTKKEEVVFWIVTGLSGAGKTNVLRILEDWSYFCIDNLPPALLCRTAEMIVESGNICQVALGIDVRGRRFFDEVIPSLETMKAQGFVLRVLYLEAGTDTLVRRFKETRRRHPMASEGKLLEDIQSERKLLDDLRGIADVIIDTSELKVTDLKNILEERILGGKKIDHFNIYVVSFGYKYGIPLDADLVVDVRFLPNPHYDPVLKPFTGLDAKVRDFVLNREVTQGFFQRYFDLLTYLIPYYIEEGKSNLVIAVGCTGGQHRSVALAEKFNEALRKESLHSHVHHRDISRSKG